MLCSARARRAPKWSPTHGPPPPRTSARFVMLCPARIDFKDGRGSLGGLWPAVDLALAQGLGDAVHVGEAGVEEGDLLLELPLVLLNVALEELYLVLVSHGLDELHEGVVML